MMETVYHHFTDHRQPKADAAEVDRMMPNGVRRLLPGMRIGQDLAHLPEPILTWMDDHHMLHTPTKGTYAGVLCLSPLGKNVLAMYLRRMEGKE